MTSIKNYSWSNVSVEESAYTLVVRTSNFEMCCPSFEATRLIRKAEAAAVDNWQAGRFSSFGRRLHVPILAMTADVIQATSEECMRCGMDGYVAKPFDEHHLYQAVAKHFFGPN